ncbi:unnamed protein product [Closterium sp. NIES-54]
MLVHCALSPHPPPSLMLIAVFLSPVTTLVPFPVLSFPQVLSPVSTFPPYALTSSPKGPSNKPISPLSFQVVLTTVPLTILLQVAFSLVFPSVLVPVCTPFGFPAPPPTKSPLPLSSPPPPLPPTNPPLPSRPPVSDCSCRSLSHPTILLHHKLGHPNFATLRSFVSSGLLHGLLSSLPPLPKSPAPPCTVCVQSKLKQQPH